MYPVIGWWGKHTHNISFSKYPVIGWWGKHIGNISFSMYPVIGWWSKNIGNISFSIYPVKGWWGKHIGNISFSMYPVIGWQGKYIGNISFSMYPVIGWWGKHTSNSSLATYFVIFPFTGHKDITQACQAERKKAPSFSSFFPNPLHTLGHHSPFWSGLIQPWACVNWFGNSGGEDDVSANAQVIARSTDGALCAMQTLVRACALQSSTTSVWGRSGLRLIQKFWINYCFNH